MRRPHGRLHNHTTRQCAFTPSILWLIANYLLAGFTTPGRVVHQVYLECAKPADHQSGTTIIEWHHLLGRLVLLFEADSFKSISNLDPDHLIKSQALELVPAGNQCCLSQAPTDFPPPVANTPPQEGRPSSSKGAQVRVVKEAGRAIQAYTRIDHQAKRDLTQKSTSCLFVARPPEPQTLRAARMCHAVPLRLLILLWPPDARLRSATAPDSTGCQSVARKPAGHTARPDSQSPWWAA